MSVDRSEGQPKPRYQLREIGFPGEDTVIVERIETVGEFANRAAARQHMIDTEDERKARDAGVGEASGGQDPSADLANVNAAYRLEHQEVERLRAALREAGEAIVAVHHAGFDSDRLRLAAAGVEAITAALDGGER